MLALRIHSWVRICDMFNIELSPSSYGGEQRVKPLTVSMCWNNSNPSSCLKTCDTSRKTIIYLLYYRMFYCTGNNSSCLTALSHTLSLHFSCLNVQYFTLYVYEISFDFYLPLMRTVATVFLYLCYFTSIILKFTYKKILHRWCGCSWALDTVWGRL